MKKGGYAIIEKTSASLYADLTDALASGKAILFYEDDTTCYYIDTISMDGDDNIVITKGGKTITIADDGTITESGNIQPSASGTKYIHNILIQENADLIYSFHLVILNNSNETLTYNDILNYLKDDFYCTYDEDNTRFDGDVYTLGIDGGQSGATSEGADCAFVGKNVFGDGTIDIIYFGKHDSEFINSEMETTSNATITDIIIEL